MLYVINEDFLPIWVYDIDATSLGMYGKAFVEVMTAIFCGLIIGQERQRREKPAGLRTLTLICLGSALFTVVSVFLAGDNVYNDPARLAAQIVTGIGFLGAGVIMRDGGSVTGLTTAATIWVVAAIGVMAGSGYCVPAVGVSVIVYILLFGLSFLERDFLHPHQVYQNWVIQFDSNQGITVLRIQNILHTYHVHVKDEDLNASELHFQIGQSSSRFRYQMLSQLSHVEGVNSISKVKPS